jgi:glucose uptake protein
MFIIDNYQTAVIFCIITMLCWGSWGNTQKLAGKTWRYELFYWDYVIGILLLSLVFAFTLGSFGTEGRPFLEDLRQADASSMGSAFLGGIIFNAANILLSSAIAIAGMSVAFPVGIGIALVLGVIINYAGAQKGDPTLLFLGVGLITVAIIIKAVAYRKTASGNNQKVSTRGLVVSVLAGILMSFFYRFIAASMDLENFASPAPGLMGGFSTHLVGVLGGLIWGVGNSFNLIAAGKAGAAVSYGLGQGATLVAALWGVFIWKEFKDAPKGVSGLIGIMLVLFLAGIVSIIYAGQ